MKNWILTLMYLIIFVVISCNNSTPSATTSEAKQDSKIIEQVENKETIIEWNKADFAAFWKLFATKTGDSEFITEHTYFPFADGYLGAVEQSSFAMPSFFEETTKVTLSELKEEDYLNYQIEELFLDTFGSKADIFAVKKDADPMGYYAYFKYMDNQFWFIGYEELQDASH